MDQIIACENNPDTKAKIFRPLSSLYNFIQGYLDFYKNNRNLSSIMKNYRKGLAICHGHFAKEKRVNSHLNNI